MRHNCSAVSRRPHPAALGLALVLGSLLGGCGCGAAGSEGAGSGGSAAAGAERPESCPATAPAPELLPGVETRHRTLAYWLEHLGKRHGDLDEPLLGADEVVTHNLALRRHALEHEPLGQLDLREPVDAGPLGLAVQGRLQALHERIGSGAYVAASGEPADGTTLARFEPRDLPPLRPSLHSATAPVPLRCGPWSGGLYKPDVDLAFDRNACSMVREGEPVQVLADWGGGMMLARTPYVLGWIAADAPLSAPLSGAAADAVMADSGRPLSRKALLEAGFAQLDAPYGWGGYEGGRDCSRFVLDLFGTFGLRLPRHSARQAKAGTFAIDVAPVSDEQEKLRIIEAAADRGAVLLHFPGHIMLYLGRTAEGRPMALHSFSEYVEPCAGTRGPEGRPLETLRRVDRVTVSDLELGRGSSRTSFIERVTRVVVIGRGPGPELAGVAELRPAAPPVVPEGAACTDSLSAAIFRSPQRPHSGAPLRVIFTSTEDPGPSQLVLVDPKGQRHVPEARRLGGPPYTHWAEVRRPPAGRWTAVIGDGERTVACERFVVQAPPKGPDEEAGPVEGPAWEPRWKWEEDTENLYSAFVEQLFTDPVDEEVTWPHLQEVLSDPARNLLFDHLGLDEDRRLHLEPDCADLPYFLRAYFAWKIRLPFAYRGCTRGKAGRPPMCGEIKSAHDPVSAPDPVAAFREVARRIANTVHSASARTAPADEATDLYPVPLTRHALRPGTVFADPYGHLLVVAAWRPQGLSTAGVLVGADAQPDGTVGRRRFWRGSFLYTPDTTDVGAGFKRWRPIVYETDEQGEQGLRALDNATMRTTREHVPYSEEQYEAPTADAFYDGMEALINPRAREPVSVLVSLVDALEESALRRVTSVDTGEAFMARRAHRPIDMPEGYAIFETRGPWEDFATPSRDMRLLISIDAVAGFPDAVARNPARFGLDAGKGVEATVKVLRERLSQELRARSVKYTRSDGSSWKLTLEELVGRRRDLEMAYNPNDCVELRWAAQQASDERKTCARTAPDIQRQRMAEYRPWFAERRRPPR
jgi:hypothetical protein